MGNRVWPNLTKFWKASTVTGRRGHVCRISWQFNPTRPSLADTGQVWSKLGTCLSNLDIVGELPRNIGLCWPNLGRAQAPRATARHIVGTFSSNVGRLRTSPGSGSSSGRRALDHPLQLLFCEHRRPATPYQARGIGAPAIASYWNVGAASPKLQWCACHHENVEYVRNNV